MIDDNQQALLELLKASLFGMEPLYPEGVDWDAVLKEARDQTVAALAAPAVPAQEASKWQISVARNKMRFLQILDEQTKLAQLFDDAGIPMAIIKGCAAAMYYPIPLNRSMGDIDFVVPFKRVDEANQLMTENGYHYSNTTQRHYDYAKNGIEFELHHHYSDPDWDFENLISEGLSNVTVSEIYDKQFHTLPVEINGLVLLDHVRRHIMKGLGMRQIIDWMMFVHAELNTDSAWEERFASLAREIGLETLAITMTKTCKSWLGLPDEISWCDSADAEAAQQLLELVFHFGNFGRKNQIEHQAAESFTAGVRKQGLFRYLQNTGEKNWEIYHKHKELRPFAWLYQSFRFMGKGTAALFRGERFSQDLSVGKERAGLYHKLGIDKAIGAARKNDDR